MITKKYTGTVKNEADSRIPRKFNVMINKTITTEIKTLCACKLGIADVIASVPDVTETATVSI